MLYNNHNIIIKKYQSYINFFDYPNIRQKNWVKQGKELANNMNAVKIRKSGTFYCVFDDDCYIVHFLLGYQINNQKVGFPASALNKVKLIMKL